MARSIGRGVARSNSRARLGKPLPSASNPLLYDILLQRSAAGRLIVQKPKQPAVAGQLIRWRLSGFDHAVIGSFLSGSVCMIREDATPASPACAMAVAATPDGGTYYRISVELPPTTRQPLASVLFTLIVTDTFPGPFAVGRPGG